jgi:hypothetical protein
MDKELDIELDDDISSIYSRSPNCPKFSTPAQSKLNSASSDLPEINSLDHQISLASGSTIALETTSARLQPLKYTHGLSLHRLREEKLQQLKTQEDENRFYRSCCENFFELSAGAIDVMQDLLLQPLFEPETSPVGNEKV